MAIKFVRSFLYAWHGIKYCIKTQLNFRVQLSVCLLVIIAGYLIKLSNTEWLFISASSFLVLVLELLNTAIEHLCDIITTEIHPAIKIIKDVSAAAVLLAACGSIITGLLIFIPKIITLFNL